MEFRGGEILRNDLKLKKKKHFEIFLKDTRTSTKKVSCDRENATAYSFIKATVNLFVICQLLCSRVTREYREKLAKSTKAVNDKTKEKLKSIQNKYIKEAKKKKDEVSSDLLHHVQEHVSIFGNI